MIMVTIYSNNEPDKSKRKYYTALIILASKLIFTTPHDKWIGDLTTKDIRLKI